MAELTPAQLEKVISTRWVKTRKSDGTCRCRIVVRGYDQVVDETYASTPSLFWSPLLPTPIPFSSTCLAKTDPVSLSLFLADSPWSPFLLKPLSSVGIHKLPSLSTCRFQSCSRFGALSVLNRTPPNSGIRPRPIPSLIFPHTSSASTGQLPLWQEKSHFTSCVSERHVP